MTAKKDGPGGIRRDDEARAQMAARIESRMEVLHLNPFSAAKKAGLGADFVRDILRGKVKNPSAERLGKLATALECSLNYLLGIDEGEARFGLGEAPAAAPPRPLPIWEPRQGVPAAHLLPIRYELMADAFRPATDVTRPPLGFEASTIFPAIGNRHFWWELMRDGSMGNVAPEGSLVLVAEYGDDERDKIEDGDYVIIIRRLVGPDSAFHFIERSMRLVKYYPDDGQWRLELSSGGPNALPYFILRWDEAAGAKMRTDAAARRNSEEKYVLELSLPDAATIRSGEAKLDFRLVGKAVRVLTPLDPRGGFGVNPT